MGASRRAHRRREIRCAANARAFHVFRSDGAWALAGDGIGHDGAQ